MYVFFLEMYIFFLRIYVKFQITFLDKEEPQIHLQGSLNEYLDLNKA